MQEEAALQQVEDLAEGAKAATGATLAQGWSELAEERGLYGGRHHTKVSDEHS